MPTIIDQQANFGGTTSSLTFSSVQAGDTIILFTTAFDGFGVLVSLTDNQSNTYTGPFNSNNGGFGALQGFFAVAKSSGSLTVTIVYTGIPITGHLENFTGVQYRGMPPYDQCAVFVGTYSPTHPNGGAGTGPFTLADTTTITYVYDQGGTTAGQFVFSDSGGTLVYQPSTNLFYVFQRDVSGPGNSRELFHNTDGADGLGILSLVFSKPLARPGGLAEQYAVRGGQGFENESTATTELKLPLVASLPYLPLLGSLVCVGGAYSACTANGATLSVGDDYGNTYTKEITSVGAGSSIALWYTVVTNLPTNGGSFRVRMSGSTSGCSGVAYQATILGVAEKVMASLVNVAAAAWSSDIDASPNQTYISNTINGVAASTFLFGFVAGGPDINQTGMTWTALDGYAIQQQQNFIQFPFALSNDSRIGPGAILTKFVNASGSYNVRAVGTTTGTFNESGSIALLALTITLSVPVSTCPVNNTGTIGVLYDGQINASGGFPPYTYKIL